jgi:hypothetical protein
MRVRRTKFLAATIALAVISLGAAESVGSTPAGTAASKCVSHAGLPDLKCTPGALNPDVKQSTIRKTICVANWTDTVRPPTSYTNRLKVQGIADYGFKDKTLGHFEEDHLIPLASWRLAAVAQEPLARAVQRQVRRPCEGQARAVPARPRLRRHGAALEGAEGLPRLEGRLQALRSLARCAGAFPPGYCAGDVAGERGGGAALGQGLQPPRFRRHP